MKKRKTKPLNDAQRLLVEQHITLAMNLGRKYKDLGRQRGIPVEDLQQEACMGLCVAAKKYKDGDTEFATYAYYWCKKYIMCAIEGKQIETVVLFDEDQDDYQDLPYDQSGEDDEAAELIKQKFENCIQHLNKTQYAVISLVYGFEGEPLDFRQVALKLHLTKERVMNIYNTSINIMEIYGKKY